MTTERVVKTFYRCVMASDGSVWCESSNKREVLMAGQQTGESVRFESFSVVQRETPWTPFEPSEREAAQAKQDVADEEAEYQFWIAQTPQVAPSVPWPGDSEE